MRNKSGQIDHCMECGIEVYRDLSRIKGNKRAFCSKRCYWAFRSNNDDVQTGTMIECLTCRNPVYRATWQRVNKRVFCNRKCYWTWLANNTGAATSNWKGGPVVLTCKWCDAEFTVERRLCKKTREYCSVKCRNSAMSGENHPAWKGGISSERDSAKRTEEYRQWRIMVFRRDHFTCVACLSKDKIEAHHLKPFSEFPEIRFDVDNGATLCRPCHNQISRLESMFEDFLRKRILRDFTLDTREPMPLAKIKSDLYGDIKRLAEMPSPARYVQ